MAGAQEGRPLLAARSKEGYEQAQQTLVALPSAYDFAVQVQAVAAGIPGHLERRSTNSWERHKKKLALTFRVMRAQYLRMMKTSSWRHSLRLYMRKQQAIESLQAAELLLSEALAARTFRDLLNRYWVFTDGHSRTSSLGGELEELSIEAASGEGSAALLELLKIFVCFALLAEPPALDVVIEGQTGMYWDVSRDINCENARQKLLRDVQQNYSPPLFPFDVRLLQEDQILRQCTIFFRGFDAEERTLETRTLGCYREMLSGIIADLRCKVDNVTALQNKLLSAVTTAVFALISFIFNRYARHWLEGDILETFAGKS